MKPNLEKKPVNETQIRVISKY